MGKKIFVANWKANKNTAEMREWVKEAKEGLEKSEQEIIVCPSFASLEVMAWELKDSSIKLGAQNVSSFPSGAYTGEVNADMLKGLVNYVIVGHSERWKYFGEDEAKVIEKVKQLLEAGITPILCVADLSQLHTYLQEEAIKNNAEKIIFTYEPPSAISGGGNYKPEGADEVAKVVAEFKNKLGTVKVLYGGSVNPEVIESFLQKEEVDGFLIGKASLTPETFIDLVSKK